MDAARGQCDGAGTGVPGRGGSRAQARELWRHGNRFFGPQARARSGAAGGRSRVQAEEGRLDASAPTLRRAGCRVVGWLAAARVGVAISRLPDEELELVLLYHCC